MNIRDNVRFNRTKMLDEAALNHRPTHFVRSFLLFMIVYFAADLARQTIMLVPSMIYIYTSDAFIETIRELVTAETINTEMYMEAYQKILEATTTNMPAWMMFVSLLSSGALIVAAILYCKLFEKRGIATLGIRKSNVALEYGVGAVIGFAMYALTFLIAYLTGSVSIVGSASFSGWIIPFLFAFIIQGAGEELLIRGYFMTSIARDYKVFLAVFFSSAVFSLIHMPNSGIQVLAFVNIFLFGVFEGIYVLKRGDIWGACAIHSMWNFTQGNIFGSSVSGMSVMPSVFQTAINPDMTAANGGEFGLEGGFAATIVILVAIGILLLVPPKKSELPDYELYRNQYTYNGQDFTNQH